MNHEPPPCGICAHRRYALDCKSYDRLVADHDGRCAICRITGPETKHGFLVVDHDYRRGYWAVRGLLCSGCNTTLDAYSHARAVREETYLANPWWQRYFSGQGWRTEPVPEPGIGAVVIIGKLRWTRTKDGWERPHRVKTWRGLNYHHGPHRIQVTSGQLALT